MKVGWLIDKNVVLVMCFLYTIFALSGINAAKDFENKEADKKPQLTTQRPILAPFIFSIIEGALSSHDVPGAFNPKPNNQQRNDTTDSDLGVSGEMSKDVANSTEISSEEIYEGSEEYNDYNDSSEQNDPQKLKTPRQKAPKLIRNTTTDKSLPNRRPRPVVLESGSEESQSPRRRYRSEHKTTIARSNQAPAPTMHFESEDDQQIATLATSIQAPVPTSDSTQLSEVTSIESSALSIGTELTTHPYDNNNDLEITFEAPENDPETDQLTTFLSNMQTTTKIPSFGGKPLYKVSDYYDYTDDYTSSEEGTTIRNEVKANVKKGKSKKKGKVAKGKKGKGKKLKVKGDVKGMKSKGKKVKLKKGTGASKKPKIVRKEYRVNKTTKIQHEKKIFRLNETHTREVNKNKTFVKGKLVDETTNQVIKVNGVVIPDSSTEAKVTKPLRSSVDPTDISKAQLMRRTGGISKSKSTVKQSMSPNLSLKGPSGSSVVNDVAEKLLGKATRRRSRKRKR